jgi:hypothetical protein
LGAQQSGFCIRILAKSLDPDPGTVNPDLDHWHQDEKVFVKKRRGTPERQIADNSLLSPAQAVVLHQSSRMHKYYNYKKIQYNCKKRKDTPCRQLWNISNPET